MNTCSEDGSDVVLVEPTRLDGESHDDFLARKLQYSDAVDRQKERDARARMALRQAACAVYGEIGNHSSGIR
jgi:hypothetical protein